MSRERRRRALYRGHKGEGQAAWLLRLKGYRVLERRWKCPVGEIDLIAKRGHLLVFVEVKARATMLEAETALAMQQRRRIARAAEAYVAAHPGTERLGLRFDVVAVAPRRWPHHIADAWRPA